jgi:hypothetical protein
MGEIGNSHNIFVGKPEGLRKFGRYRLRIEDNIKWILKQKYGTRVRTGFI